MKIVVKYFDGYDIKSHIVKNIPADIPSVLRLVETIHKHGIITETKQAYVFIPAAQINSVNVSKRTTVSTEKTEKTNTAKKTGKKIQTT